jgi:threonine synthase
MCDPVVNAYRNKRRIEHVKPRTAADAIAVGYPTFGFEVLAAIKSTNGSAVSVSEDELKDAVRILEEYGVYAELGGGTGFAGFLRMYNQKSKVFRGKKVAIIITGNNEGRFT